MFKQNQNLSDERIEELVGSSAEEMRQEWTWPRRGGLVRGVRTIERDLNQMFPGESRENNHGLAQAIRSLIVRRGGKPR